MKIHGQFSTGMKITWKAPTRASLSLSNRYCFGTWCQTVV